MTTNTPSVKVKQGGGAKAVGAFIAPVIAPALRARGFATSAILTEWAAIVGRDLASFTMPEKIIWPRRTREEDDASSAQRTLHAEGATLVLRVEGPRAIELQHSADQILSRINTHFGYRAIVQLRMLQAPIARSAPRQRKRPAPADETVLPQSARIADAGLRMALVRLGSGIKRAAGKT